MFVFDEMTEKIELFKGNAAHSSSSCPPPLLLAHAHPHPPRRRLRNPRANARLGGVHTSLPRGTHGISVWLRCYYSCLLAKPGPLSIFLINPIVVRLHRPTLALPSGTSPAFSICCLQDTLCLLFSISPTTLRSRVKRGTSLLPSP